MAQMERIIFNDRVDAVLCGFFMVVVLSILVAAVRTCLGALRSPVPTVAEMAA
jgi:carbon starvation protein